jgi:hypothetical protein
VICLQNPPLDQKVIKNCIFEPKPANFEPRLLKPRSQFAGGAPGWTSPLYESRSLNDRSLTCGKVCVAASPAGLSVLKGECLFAIYCDIVHFYLLSKA